MTTEQFRAALRVLFKPYNDTLKEEIPAEWLRLLDQLK